MRDERHETRLVIAVLAGAAAPGFDSQDLHLVVILG